MRISTAHIFNQNLAAMLNQQSELGKTQLQVSTGKRILNPSDDPAGSVQIINLQREIGLSEQYLANADKSENKLAIEEGALQSSTDIMQRIRELAVQGLNDTNSQNDRKAIAIEISQLNEQLLALANSRDSKGEYIFSGFKNDTQPYTSVGASYGGDSGQRNMQVGSGVLIETNDPGNEVFEARHVQTQVIDNAGPSSAALNITAIGIDNIFSSPVTVSYNAGVLSITDTAIPANTATVTPYIAGQSVELSSLNSNFPDFTLQFDGALANGDSYTLDTQVTASQTIFQTINEFANALSNDAVGANDSPNNGDFLANISTSMENIVTTTAKIGARMNAVDQQREINSGIAFNMKKTLSEIQDLDYAEAISRLTLQTTGLQAAQQSFVQVQGLSLFNYL